jgi:hypothetical protein
MCVGAASSRTVAGPAWPLQLAWAQAGSIYRGDTADMREMFSSFAQLAAIVLVLITLALSTAAVGQWAEASVQGEEGAAKALQVAAVSSR